MKVLSIGLDKGLFDKKSDVFWRHQSYSSWVDKYFVIIPTLKKEKKSALIWKNLEVVPTNSSSRYFYLADVVALAWRTKHHRFDLVTAQDPFLCGLAGIFIKYLLGLPLNIQIHSEFFNSPYFRQESLFNKLLYFAGLVTLPFADTIRYRNLRIKQYLLKRFPKLSGKLFYVAAPINKEFLAPLNFKALHDKNIILAQGRLVKQKNYPLLLTAFEICKRTFPKLRLEIIGTGELKSQLRNKAKLLGWLGVNRRIKAYERAGLLVLSSNHEGWGLAALEALARGCPVVMTETGCAGEIVIDGKTGYVAPVRDVEALADKIVTALQHYNHSLTLARQGRKLVLKDSSLAKIKSSQSKLFRLTVDFRND